MLERAQIISTDLIQAQFADVLLQFNDLFDLHEEPAVDFRVIEHLIHAHARAERIGDEQNPAVFRFANFFDDLIDVGANRIEAINADFQTAQGFLERLLERTANRHHFAHRFHLCGQVRVGFAEFFKRKARNLGHNVINRRLERRRCLSTGDVVFQLIQRVTHRQFRRNFRNWETRGFRGQRGRTRHTRVHFNHDHATGVGIDGELYV